MNFLKKVPQKVTYSFFQNKGDLTTLARVVFHYNRLGDINKTK